MSQMKVIKHDPDFNSKKKLLVKPEHTEIDVPPVSEKKILTATKSELRSALKFQERMTNSREASTEKHANLEARTPIKSVIKTKPSHTTTKKELVVEEKEDFVSEKKQNGNIESKSSIINSGEEPSGNSASGSKQLANPSADKNAGRESSDTNSEKENE